MSKNLTLKLNGAAFPNADNPVVLNNYKYSASRMGNAPTITATVSYPVCLDSLWTDEVYVEFRGERYFLKQTPSSSYDNTSVLYSHSLNFVSERAILDDVYFFDVVKKDNEDDKALANNSNFSFYGSLIELRDRLNRSMLWSGVGGNDGYNLVIDADVELEESLFEVSDQYISDVLKKAYETYKVPYYYVGKTIHFGYAQHIISDILKYGIKGSLLSIQKDNANKKIVNRITGIGSENNITYYYPNPSPKGLVGGRVTTGSFAFTITDQKLFSDSIELDKPLRYMSPLTDNSIVTGIRGISAVNGTTNADFHDYDASGGYHNSQYSNYQLKTSLGVQFSGDIAIGLSLNCDSRPDMDSYYSLHTSYGEPIGQYEADTYIESESGYKYYPSSVKGLNATYRDVAKGNYTAYFRIEKSTGGISDSLSGKRWYPALTSGGAWVNTATNKSISPNKMGFIIVSGNVNIGDEILPYCIKRVNVQKNLMPSIYRETDGEERWYNATNDADRDECYEDIVFNNPYTEGHPKEFIHKCEDIMPTIKGMTNALGQRFDIFSEFAYDRDDNDEIYPEDYEIAELAGKYKHPYFFGKLRKFDGEHGFNLFDHAIEGQPMTISFTSGKVGGCNFTIGVDEETGKYNLVQVYEQDVITLDGVHKKGELKRDPETGNVLSGYGPNGGAQLPQDVQQDTVNNEVWVALKKEESTFGVLMPNAENNYRPEIGDTFVILHIDLPEAYVRAAEDELEKELIKYMSENNDSKFSFNAKLSSIYFETHPEVADILNENSKATIEYDGHQYSYYVSSYSYSMKDSSALPEVSITLNDDIKVFKSLRQQVSEGSGSGALKITGVLKTQLESIESSVDSQDRRIRNNTTATKELTSAVDLVKSDVITVNESLVVTTQVAEAAKESALVANERAVTVGNELGAVKTDINAANSVANEAKAAAEETRTYTEGAVSGLSGAIDGVSQEVSGLNKDVSGLKDKIGDEYNIWFEEDSQVGFIPTLDNYPANGWTSDDDYFAHDRDLYYSISLGRAWRFAYNEGNPFWEEITDADTITALTKAQEALDKAQEAVDNVNSVAFLKDVFGDDNVLDEKAAILSRLVAVKDAGKTVTAGLYGGGVPGLDNGGYKDTEHGTLMMFAGATGANTASSANYRVYEDGTLYAESGVFSGLLRHKAITINNLNINTYFPLTVISESTSGGVLVTERFVSVDAMSAITTFDSSLSISSNIAIHLPAIYDMVLYDDTKKFTTKNDLRALVGTTFIIYNNSSAMIHLCGYRYSNGAFQGPSCYGDSIINRGYFAKVTCVLDVDSSGRELVHWVPTIGIFTIPPLTPMDE